MRVNTRVEFEWDNKANKYVEVSSEGYDYDGPVARADLKEYEGNFTGPNLTSPLDALGDIDFSIADSNLGIFWDTHFGREGFGGWVGDATGLWESGTVADERRRAKQRIKDLYGTAIESTEDFSEKIKQYYSGPGGLIGRTREMQALKNVQVGAEAQKLVDTTYGKGDMANVEQMERPDRMGSIYQSANLGLQNSILGQKLAMNKQTFELEDKVRQLEMSMDDRLDQLDA